MNKILIMVILGLFVQCAFATDSPPLPYFDNDARVFEGCQYGNWIATEDVKVYEEYSTFSPVLFTIKKDESVEALTGFVVTRQYGITKILKPISLGYLYKSNDSSIKLNLKPGEQIYTFHYTGEGNYLFWYNDKLYEDKVSSNIPDSNPMLPQKEMQIISCPVSTWWVKIKNKNGDIGWIKDPPRFKGYDAFE